jgi:uroporphyrinogen decarboxylase
MAVRPVSVERERWRVAFWRHHPGADQTVDGLVAATVAFQARHGLDLVKVTPAGTWQATDEGLKDAWRGDWLGRRSVERRPVALAGDWDRVGRDEGPRPALERACAVARAVRAALPPSVPVLQTVFTPVSVAAQLAGVDRLREHLERDPLRVAPALERLAARTAEAIAALRRSGVDGVFLACHAANGAGLPAELYRAFGWEGDLACIAACSGLRWNVLHLHGADVHLPSGPLPPAWWLHYELGEGNPSLEDCLARVGNPLVVGLPAAELAEAPCPASVLADLRRRLGDRPAVLGAGCVLPLGLPAGTVDRWVAAARATAGEGVAA